MLPSVVIYLTRRPHDHHRIADRFDPRRRRKRRPRGACTGQRHPPGPRRIGRPHGRARRADQPGHPVQRHARHGRHARRISHAGGRQPDPHRRRPRDRARRRAGQRALPRLGHQQGAAGRCVRGRHRRHHHLDQAVQWPGAGERRRGRRQPRCHLARQRRGSRGTRREQEDRGRQRHRPGRIRTRRAGRHRPGRRAERRWRRRRRRVPAVRLGHRRQRRGCRFGCRCRRRRRLGCRRRCRCRFGRRRGFGCRRRR
ncbi:hypothetical protein D3C71_702950 [compost metagenome]